MRIRPVLVASVLLLTPAFPAAAGHGPDHSDNVTLIGAVELPGATDVVLTDDGYAVQAVNGSGEAAGLWVVDVRDPAAPVPVGHLPCAGSGYDIGLWNDIAVMSIDSPSGNSSVAADGCNLEGTEGQEGIRLVDVSDRANPVEVKFLPLDCGSHTNVTFDHQGRGLVYNQSYPASTSGACPSAHGYISVVDITDPTDPQVVSKPSVQPAVGCHDGAVHGDYAYMACLTEGQVWDISDPVNPVVLTHLTWPDAIWHSSDVSNDGSTVIFGFESFGTGSSSCTGTSEGPIGALNFYDASDPANPVWQSFWSTPRLVTGLCTAHNFTVVEEMDTDVLVTAWYGGGFMAIDFTDVTAPTELGYYVPESTSTWHANVREGYAYVGDGNRGLDIYAVDEILAAAGVTPPVDDDPASDPGRPAAEPQPQPDPLPDSPPLPSSGGGLAIAAGMVAAAIALSRRRPAGSTQT